MKLMLFCLLSLGLGGCSFSGKVEPNIECTSTCQEDQQDCYDTCETECVDAGDDGDEACDTDCKTVCDEEYDTCDVSCTGSDD